MNSNLTSNTSFYCNFRFLLQLQPSNGSTLCLLLRLELILSSRFLDAPPMDWRSFQVSIGQFQYGHSLKQGVREWLDLHLLDSDHVEIYQEKIQRVLRDLFLLLCVTELLLKSLGSVSKSILYSSSNLATSKLPASAAQCKGVVPSLDSSGFISPIVFSRSNRTISKKPFMDAAYRGVIS